MKHWYLQLHAYCLDHFDIVDGESVDETVKIVPGKMKPHNFELLKKEKKFATMLRTSISQKKLLLSLLKDTKRRVKILVDKIEKELK